MHYAVKHQILERQNDILTQVLLSINTILTQQRSLNHTLKLSILKLLAY